MNNATSTFTQARNIALALTMTFAATTLAACSDESADNTPSSDTEVNTENQNNVSSDTPYVEPDGTVTTARELVTEDEAIDTKEENAATLEEENTTADDSSNNQATTNTENTDSGEAEVHTVKAVGLIYEPLVVTIKPGDTVSWVNMPTHNTKSLEGLIPEGTEHWESPISENYERTFTQEGIYVYKCVPHFGAAMGGAVIVGNPVNLEQLKNSDAKGAAGRLVRKAIAEAEKM